MIEPDLQGLSVGKQSAVLSIPRSSCHAAPKGETEPNLDLMRPIDKQVLEPPFFGARQMSWHLAPENRIRRRRWLLGLMPIWPQPDTCKAAQRHRVYTCLLRG